MRPSACKLIGGLIACALFFAPSLPAAAQTPDAAHVYSIGEYVDLSAAIAMAEVKKSDSSGCQSVLELGEFLKGKAPASKRGLCVPPNMRCYPPGFRDCAMGYIQVPPDSGRAVALLWSGWESKACPFVEVYWEAQEIAAVRAFVKVYALPSERRRLEELRALASDPNPRFRQELFAAFERMRNPANFPIILDLFGRLDPAGQTSAVEVLESIGDVRGVPTLIKALDSPDSRVSLAAARVLETQFRWFPGVEEALRKIWDDSDPRIRFRKAEALRDSRRMDRARPLFLAVAQDQREDEQRRYQSIVGLLPSPSPSERSALRDAVHPLFARLSALDLYTDSASTSGILRAFGSARDLDLLIPLLASPKTGWDGYWCRPCDAAMAIWEFGPAARRSAAERLLGRLGSLSDDEFLALLWLGDGALIRRASVAKWEAFLPLLGVGQQQDEGTFLISVLRNHPNLPSLAQHWIAFRLGDLKEKRSVGELFDLFKHSVRIHKQLQIVPVALGEIGGPDVEAEAAKMLTDPSPEVKRFALDILCQLGSAKALPSLRGMLAGDDDAKFTAVAWMGSLGEPEDLKALVPMADFWTGERANRNHHWAALAVAGIRWRYHLIGPLDWQQVPDRGRLSGQARQ